MSAKDEKIVGKSPVFIGQTGGAIGEVAYKLELPSTSQIHNVFHVSQLKKCRDSSPDQAYGKLPPCDPTGVFLVEPLAILDRRMAKKGNGMEIYVIVQWINGTTKDATWESITELQSKLVIRQIVWRFEAVARSEQAAIGSAPCVLSTVVDKDSKKPKGRGGRIAKSLPGSAWKGRDPKGRGLNDIGVKVEVDILDEMGIVGEKADLKEVDGVSAQLPLFMVLLNMELQMLHKTTINIHVWAMSASCANNVIPRVTGEAIVAQTEVVGICDLNSTYASRVPWPTHKFGSGRFAERDGVVNSPMIGSASGRLSKLKKKQI
ncbi:retrotransposable element Tf2 [Tanacetum coccineum]